MNISRFTIAAALSLSMLNAGNAKVESANQMLADAFANMYKLNSMRARADLHIGKGSAAIMAGFAKDSTFMEVTEFTGKHSQGVLRGETGFVSDDGKKWTKDTQDVNMTRYRMLIAPIAASAKIVQQGTFAVAGTETLDGMQATKVVGTDKIKAEYWIIEHPQLGKLVRKAHTVITLDRDVDEWVTYYDYNATVQIPAVQ